MKTPAPDTLDILQTLKSAVAETLERKRRLGHYAVFWKDGKIVFTEGDRGLLATRKINATKELNEDSAHYKQTNETSEPK